MDTARQIRAAIAAVERPYHCFPYPPDLRARVVGFARHRRTQGASWRTIGDEVGVDPSSVHGWCAGRPAGESSEGAGRGGRGDVGLVPVVVMAEPAPPAPRPSGSGSAMSLVTPGGYRLEGLDLHDDLFERLIDKMPQLARPARGRSRRPYQPVSKVAA